MSAVLLAAPDVAAEPELVAALAALRSGAVRRCVDAVDLLGAAVTGGASTALIGARLPRLSADVIERLHLAGVRVIGICHSDDSGSSEALARLGVSEVVRVRPGDVSAAVHAVEESPEPVTTTALKSTGGRLVAVWGPYGSPGRTTVSVALADELARRGDSVMLIDADPFGGAVGSHLGMLDEASGLVAACRRADQGALDLAGLARSARSLSRGLRVLTGLDSPERWTHIRPAALTRVLRLSRDSVATTIVDSGFCLDDGGEPTRGRAAATTVSINEADAVVAVASGEHVGIGRLASALPALRTLVDDRPIHVVVNRVRGRVVGKDAQGQIHEALRRLCDIHQAHLLADDPATCDAAMREGRTLAEVAPRSPLRMSLEPLLTDVASIGARPTPQQVSAA